MSFFVPILIFSMALAVLLSLAGYAVFARPQSHEWKKRQQEIKDGYKLAGGVLVGFILLTSLIVGVGVAFFRLESPRVTSRTLALMLVVLSVGCIALTVQRWAKYFPGWIGYGVWNGISMISSGHLLNNPKIKVGRPFAITITGLCLVTALVCLRFTEDYELNWVDKVALVGWMLAFAVAANIERYGLAAFSVSCAGLVIAWLYSRSLRHPKRRRPHEAISS